MVRHALGYLDSLSASDVMKQTPQLTCELGACFTTELRLVRGRFGWTLPSAAPAGGRLDARDGSLQAGAVVVIIVAAVPHEEVKGVSLVEPSGEVEW